MASSKRLRKQKAIIEFAACKDTVVELLAQDFNPKLIHEQLVEQGRISMAYPSFTQILRNIQRERADIKPAAAPVRSSGQKSPSNLGPRIVNTAKESFPDPRKMSLEDGI